MPGIQASLWMLYVFSKRYNTPETRPGRMEAKEIGEIVSPMGIQSPVLLPLLGRTLDPDTWLTMVKTWLCQTPCVWAWPNCFLPSWNLFPPLHIENNSPYFSELLGGEHNKIQWIIQDDCGPYSVCLAWGIRSIFTAALCDCCCIFLSPRDKVISHLVWLKNA